MPRLDHLALGEAMDGEIKHTAMSRRTGVMSKCGY
jgi:hypothetical protein